MATFKLIDMRTREVLLLRLEAMSHTDAEQFAKSSFPERRVVASLHHADSSMSQQVDNKTPKKRKNKKR